MADVRSHYSLTLLCALALVGCASRRQQVQSPPAVSVLPQAAVSQLALAANENPKPTTDRSLTDSAVRQVSHVEPEPLPAPQVNPVDLSSMGADYPIDLVTAL